MGNKRKVGGFWNPPALIKEANESDRQHIIIFRKSYGRT
jgi:hypothetical protein